MQGRNHRTDSVDYAVILSGEIDMEMDGTTVHLKGGDVLVQRGTIHNWVNRGTAPCTIAFVLIDAKPVTSGGKVLHADGAEAATIRRALLAGPGRIRLRALRRPRFRGRVTKTGCSI